MAADVLEQTISSTSGGAPTRTFRLPLFNLDATVDPGASDDDTQGYAKGSRWTNITGKKDWVCVDNTTGAAIWNQTDTVGAGGPPTGAAGGDLAGTYPNPTVAQASGSWATGGVITPAQLTASQTDYNPAGLSTATVLRLSTNGGNFSIFSLGTAAQPSGRRLWVKNVGGSGTITLVHGSALGTAAARFSLPNSLAQTLPPSGAVELIYDTTISRWQLASAATPSSTTDNQITSGNILVSDGSFFVSSTMSNDATINSSGQLTIANLAITTAKIAADAVTYAKMQNVSAPSLVLGRKTAGAGDPEECSLSEVLDFIGSAAQGDILYRGAATWARLAAGTSGNFLKTLGAGANPTWAAAPASITLRSVTILTSGSGATYNTPAGAVALRVMAVGGGGSGGGAGNTAGAVSVGGGGGSGGYAEKWFFSPAATFTYTVGTGATGATAGNNNGNTGNNTSFGTLTANGGAGGVSLAAGSALSSQAAGGAGGTGSGADLQVGGEAGLGGIRLSATQGWSGQGGSNPLGMGGQGKTAQGNGNAGTGYGAGSSGALSTGSSTQSTPAGKDGVIVVEEYY
jgi:hypothetical protein